MRDTREQNPFIFEGYQVEAAMIEAGWLDPEDLKPQG